MRKSTKQLNKELLDSLAGKNVAASCRISMVKNGLTRVLATALAILMLFSTIAGPVSSGIWSRAANATEQENEIIQHTDEVESEEETQNPELTPNQQPTPEPTPDSTPEPTPEPQPTPEPELPPTEQDTPTDTDNDESGHPQSEGEQNNESTPNENDPITEPPTCICKIMCIEYLYENGETELLINKDCRVCAEDYTLCAVQPIGIVPTTVTTASNHAELVDRLTFYGTASATTDMIINITGSFTTAGIYTIPVNPTGRTLTITGFGATQTIKRKRCNG